MSTSPHFDLNSMFGLQQNYATDLSYVSIDVNNKNTIADLNTKLANLSSSDANSQLASNSVLYKQELINDILTTESDRLQQKKQNIDSAITGQQRMIELNNSYQKRYTAYTKMAIAFSVGLVIYIFMNKLMILLPFIPEFIFYILISIILGCIIIYIYLLYVDVQRRNVMNYDEIMVTTPNVVVSSPNGSAPAPASSQVSAASPVGCYNQDCCSTGTTYSPTQNKCV